MVSFFPTFEKGEEEGTEMLTTTGELEEQDLPE